MTDARPIPPDRPDPSLDPADDSDKPAFDWMTPAAGSRTEAPEAGVSADGGAPEQAPQEQTEASSPVLLPADASARNAQGRRADRAARRSRKGRDAGFSEPLPTSTLQIRPPQADVERRNAEREAAARAKPILPRLMQVLLAVFYPVILLVLAVRAVTSPLFLWVEYHRPGFPGDGYGFSTEDRMTYGSYAVDYLTNWSAPRYLGDLVGRNGDKLFQASEVSHMADVKLVIQSAFAAGAVLVLLALVIVAYLRRRGTGGVRRGTGGVRRGLFAGAVITLAVIIGLGVLAVLSWEQFFTEFHRIFFASGTWTFSLQDTLIRLFPGQFWVDAGIVVGALVLLAALVTLILTWPTRRRRGLAAGAAKPGVPAAAGPALSGPAATDTGTGTGTDQVPGTDTDKDSASERPGAS